MRTASTVQAAVAEALRGLVPRGSRVLVACSGGADSVALAAALSELPGMDAAIGHIDHGLRAESAAEAAAVQALAARLGVPFFVERLEGLQIRLQDLGLEAAARDARYAALARLARAAGASFVATAHTRRDQAETLLLRLARGAGPAALAGVRAQRALSPGVLLVRPLLHIGREATEAYCAERGLAFTNDPHNSDPARARARLRGAWAVLRELNPRLEQALAGTAELLAEEDELVASLAEQALQELGDARGLDCLKLSLVHPALQRRVLLAAATARGVRPERVHLEQLLALVSRGDDAALDLPGGRAAVCERRLSFERGHAAPAPPDRVAVPGPGCYLWGVRTLRVADGEGELHRVDASQAPFPWTLRGHGPGDRFQPARGRLRKVADLLREARIPRDQRRNLAVLCDASGILIWVEGLREGKAGGGPSAKNSPVSFGIHPEMDGDSAGFRVVRRGDPASATMASGVPDEEP